MDVSKCFIWGSKIEWMHLEMSVCQSEEESLLVDGHSNYLETTISPIFFNFSMVSNREYPQISESAFFFA